MKLLRIGLLIMLFAGFVACKKKEYPESVVKNDTVFYFNGNVNGQPISVGAGIDDYYMFASYNQDSGGVYNFIGHLKSLYCSDGSNCPKSVRVQLRNYASLAQGAAVNTQSAFVTTSYPFAEDIMGYAVTFNGTYNRLGTYKWDFGDGETSTDQNPTHIYKKSGVYTACFTATSNNAKACVSTVCNTVKVGLPGNPCTTSIFTSNLGNTFFFNQNSSGTGSLSYFWQFGDGFTSTSPNPQHTYAVLGGYPVTLRVRDANGDEALSTYNIITPGDGSSCAANYKITDISYSPAPNLSSAKFEWTDENGNVYSSDRITQPASSFFQVLSVEDYGNNEKGQKTKKIRLKLKCELSDGTNTISIDNAEAVICVAYR